MAGWAAGALLPVAQLVQPLRLLTWQDTLPSGRDVEEALGGALQVRRRLLVPCGDHCCLWLLVTTNCVAGLTWWLQPALAHRPCGMRVCVV